jgi:site-specific DNA-methyltransferase (adenine-specific)
MSLVDLILPNKIDTEELIEVYRSNYGILYQGDCITFLNALPDESVDVVFADPPFNLGKNYGKNIEAKNPALLNRNMNCYF